MPRQFGVHLLIPSIFAALFAGHAASAETLAVDATGCLHVVRTGPSGTCDAQSKSMRIELENACKRPVRAQICLRGPNKLWVDCVTDDSVAPGGHFFGGSCNTSGDYTYWGCSKVSGSSACGGNDLTGKAINAPK
jgi:hypothetical protein